MNTHKQKSRSLFLTLGGAVLLIAGGAIAYWLLVQRESGRTLPIGTQVVPQQALVSISVSTDPQQWQKLAALGSPGIQQTVEQGVQSLTGRFLASSGFNYAEDIQPWIGEQVTVAFLPPTPQVAATPANPQSIVWILPIKNLEKARQALSANATQSDPATRRTYNSVEIQQLQGQAEQTYDLAILDGKLVVVTSNSPTMDQVIDTFRGGAALVDAPGYTNALSTIQAAPAFAQVYVNLPAATASLAASSGKQLPPETLKNLEATQGLGSTLVLESSGIHFKTISWLKPEVARKLTVENNGRQIAQRLPTDTLVMASGGNFQQFWQEYSQNHGSQLVTPLDPQQFRANIQTATGMDFDQDFARWMGDEFAVALLPAQGKPSNGVGLALLAKAKDRNIAVNSLKQLDNVVRDRLDFRVTESQVGNQTVSTWRVPPGLPVATHGWLEGDVAFLTLGAPVTEAILPTPKATLADSKLFQQVTRSELRPHSSQFYIDVSRTLSLMDNSPLLPQLSPKAREFAQGIRAIGVTTAVRNDWSTRHDIRLELQKP